MCITHVGLQRQRWREDASGARLERQTEVGCGRQEQKVSEVTGFELF